MSDEKIMAADVEATPARKKRYARAVVSAGLLTLTPTKIAMLRFLAEMRFLSLPQMAHLCCPSEREDLSQKSARKHLRTLFDAGLVDVLPVSRLALAPLDAPNDETLLYGSAPNVYTSTVEGLQILYKAGLICRDWAKRAPAAYGPKNSLFLAHELQVRDVRVWLERCARASGGEQKVLTWKDGQDAAVYLGQDCSPRWVRPDAWFVYRVRSARDEDGTPTVLVAFVEVDRGTERGTTRWKEKTESYKILFDGGKLREATGYQNARVLVIAPFEQRSNTLISLLATLSNSEVTCKFWFATAQVLSQSGLNKPFWQLYGSGFRHPLCKP